MENPTVCLEKNRAWPMFASAVVVLLLTLAFTPAHSLARWVGFGVVSLCVVLAVLVVTVLGSPNCPSYDDDEQG